MEDEGGTLEVAAGYDAEEDIIEDALTAAAKVKVRRSTAERPNHQNDAQRAATISLIALGERRAVEDDFRPGFGQDGS